jgi:hypothetical protein
MYSARSLLVVLVGRWPTHGGNSSNDSSLEARHSFLTAATICELPIVQERPNSVAEQ